MDVELDIRLNATKNAELYFESSKKAKKKLKGTGVAIENLRSAENVGTRKEQHKKRDKKPLWFQQYRWFYTSNGNLAIGGRDAQTNEDLIKKHTDRNDTVFHADIAGSPFFILKQNDPSGKRETSDYYSEKQKELEDKRQKELQEMADATASFSKAWGAGASDADVYYVLPDQVSKSAKAGEYLTKGSFMIYGKKNYLHGNLVLFAKTVKMKNGENICITPIKSNDCFARLTPGTSKSSDAAKKILEFLSSKSKRDIIIDEIQKAIPGDGINLEILK